MSELTLLTCTRNGSRMLKDVLAAYSRQRLDRPIDFDVLIVDNGSTDGTVETARLALAEYALRGEVISEPKPGKINAFLRGLSEAKGDLVSVIDDDNIIGEDFVARTVEWFERMPQVGMVGSHNRLGGVPMPVWFGCMAGWFACASPSLENVVISEDNGSRVGKIGIIAGAGSTFRRTPVLNAVRAGFEFFNDTRRDARMGVTGEDLELCWLLHSLGFWFVSDPRITLEHHISLDRLSWRYARRLCRSIGAGGLASDAFIVTSPEIRSQRFGGMRCTWQWQCVSKSLRLLRNWRWCILAVTGNHEGNKRVLRADADFAALKRILLTRSKYTEYMNNLVTAEWARERVA